VSQITILLLYLLAAVAFAMSRLPNFVARTQPLLIVAVSFVAAALMLHSQELYAEIYQTTGLRLSIAGAASLIGLQLAIIGLLGALEPTLRGMTAGLLLLASVAMIPMGLQPAEAVTTELTWQLRAHILIALFAYGLLAAGAIVALYALIQDRVENLFAQHLVHKTAFSLLALVLFSVLVAGRAFAGWRGKRAVYLYLWGFAFLCLAYFGSRFVLEELLGRSWG
jgi:ABC-type uncharacterized transport system permease subunit